MKKTGRRAVLWLGVLGLLVPARAYGQPDTAIAEQLFRDGRSLIESGKVDEACEKFAASERLAPALGTQLNLALCREQQGKTATAWSLFVDAEAAAQRRGDTARTSMAREHRMALEGRLKKVVIDATALPAEAVVKLDDTVLPPAALGSEIPLDPGSHRLTVSAPGKMVWDQSLSLDGSAATVHVQVVLQDETPSSAARGPAASSPTAAPGPSPASPTSSVTESTVAIAPPGESASPSPETPSSSSPGAGSNVNVKRIAGFAVGGAGVVFLGVAGYYGLTAISRKNDESNYPLEAPARLTVYDQARTAQTWGFVFGGLGIAALATGTYLVIASWTGAAPSRAAWQVTPSVGPGFAGASVGGAF